MPQGKLKQEKKYKVRGNLKKTLPGPYYQVLVALSHMLSGLKKNKKFDVMVEVAGVGALDDILLIYYDDKKEQETERYYLQLKHCIDPSQKKEILKEADLTGVNGEFEIFKYFDDWCLFVDAKIKAPAAYFIYYSNRDFDKLFLDENGSIVVGDKEEGYKFSPAFFDTTKNLLYKKMLETIEQNSVMCNRTLLTKASSQKIGNNPTYKEAQKYYGNDGKQLSSKAAQEKIQSFLKHYTMMVGQLGVEKLEDELFKKIEEFFPDQADSEAIFNALIVEVWRWFRVLKEAEVWSEKVVKEKLDDFEKRFKKLPQEVGKTLNQLSQPLKKLESKIERNDTLDQIKKLIESADNLIVFEGKPEVGKTVLISDYCLNKTKFKYGEYIYFASFDDFLKEYKGLLKLEFLTVFIIDNIRQDSVELQEVIKILGKHRKKLILVSNVKLKSTPQSHEINPLSKKEIEDYLKSIGKIEYVLNIGEKNIPLAMLSELQSGGLFECMQYPKALQKLCKLSKPVTIAPPGFGTNFHAETNPYVPNLRANFEPIPLEAYQILTLYTLEELYKLEEFKGAKIVQCQPGDNHLIYLEKLRSSSSTDYVVLDISLIGLEADQNLMFNIKLLLAQKLNENQKEQLEKGKLTLLLIDTKKMMSSLPENILQTVFDLPYVVVFSMQNFARTRAKKFHLINQQGKYYYGYQAKVAKFNEDSNFKLEMKFTIERLLKEEDTNLENTLIIAKRGGSGKSTTLQGLYKDHVKSKALIWGKNYHHLVFVPLVRLATLKLTSLLEVCKHFLNIKEPIFEKALELDLLNKKVLFLLDAWDEINNEERKQLEPLLNLFQQYQHIVVTTRDQQHLFFNPAIIYELREFDVKQISDCFLSYFKSCDQNNLNPRLVQSFAENATRFIETSKNKKLLKIIGVPLQCYLLCESWWPAFDAIYRGVENVPLPWEKKSLLNEAYLYQTFVISRLRKLLYSQYFIERKSFLQSNEEVCSLFAKDLEALQRAAFQQIFKDTSIILGKDWFAERLRRLDLIDNFAFIHRTFAEYFSALYLVSLLGSNFEKAKKLIFKYRYQARYHPVFEFMASIISYGDSIIPATKLFLKDFWSVLLQAPRDCIGVIDKALVQKCYFQSNEQVLKSIFESQELFSTQEERSEKEELPTPKRNMSLNRSNSSLDMMQSYFVEPSLESMSQKSSEKFKEYIIRVICYIEQDIPVERYNIDEKQKVLNWLLKKIETTKIFRIKEACIEKIGKIGIATSKVLSELTKFLAYKEDNDKSRVRKNTVQCLVELQVELNTLNLSDPVFRIFAEQLLSINISPTVIKWLRKQDFSGQQVSVLLESLKAVSFATQQTVVEILADSKKEGILDKFEDFLKSIENDNTLYYCLQYSLIKAKRIEPVDYFKRVLLIDYGDEEIFNIVHELIKPVGLLLNEPSIAELFKESWIDKLYDFSMKSIKEHKNRNTISHFVAELANLKLDSERMEKLLTLFLSKDVDVGYWDRNAVIPALPYLAPYFSQALADYIKYKIINAKVSKRFSELINLKFAKDLPDDKARFLFTKTCLEIYKIRKFETKDFGRDNPIYYVQIFKPNLVLNILLNEPVDDKVRAFLKQYLELNSYGLTVHNDKAIIYMPVGTNEKSISQEISEQLSKINGEKLYLLKTTLAESRSSSHALAPMEFVLEYPGAFLSKKRKQLSSAEGSNGEEMIVEQPSTFLKPKMN